MIGLCLNRLAILPQAASASQGELEVIRLVLAVLVTIALAGCGGEDGGGEQDPVQSAASPATKTQPTARPPTPVRSGPGAIAAGPLLIDPGSLDFGIIEPKSSHRGTLTLHNTGTQPITIIAAKPTCLCTAPQDVAGVVIPPGSSIPFSSDFNAPAELGLKTAQIQLVFEHGGQQRHAIIKLQGEITMAVRADPPYVDALKGVTSGQARIESVDGRAFRIISTDGEPAIFLDGSDPNSDQPRNAYTVRWNIEPRGVDDCDGARLWWVVETDHPECPILPMRIRHECTGVRRDAGHQQRGWRFKEYIVNLGGLRSGQGVEVDVDLPNPGRVRINAVQSTTADAQAELMSTRETTGGTTTCRVRFTPRVGYQGMLYAMVMFSSDTGDKDIAFIARVLPADRLP